MPNPPKFPPVAGPPPALTDSARAVLRTVSTSGPITRPQLGALLAFSKPTMSAAVGELEALGLVASRGTVKGPTGRTAVTYGLGSEAGVVVGVDAGTTHTHAIAAGLDGRPIAEVDLASSEIEGAVEQVLGGVRRDGPLRAIAVAVPTIVSSALAPRGRGKDLVAIAQRLQARFGVPILLENNVNCAALAELREGTGRASFIYLQVGVKIGLGIIIDGRLFRGFNGAAGEVGRLPFPWSATETPRLEALEEYLGSASLVARCARDWPADEGTAPQSAEELFARAATSAHARACIDRHAADIGRLVAACVGVLDPGLAVLGGGVGQNELMVEQVARTVAELTWPTEIAVSRLTRKATVLGAVGLAADYSLGTLLGEDRRPAFSLLPAADGEPRPARRLARAAGGQR
ncbi:ROK family transcriptional regulator [Mycobacterium sp. KBS0706]|uniref:ROK family transcriptional regulator n=1 Tax=Mycobacterium sp. KBS0706 TaxID=2578109 RepID=UPI00110FE6B2|nr:ROK family transcriptional regulator [Mycobacterium sp. KBS0706]TSD84345.1 ROK family transcriptional regulator [Mycobacterium sp. KBS0706]